MNTTDTISLARPTPEVPAWLNLSAIIDDNLIRDIDATADEVERVVGELLLPLIKRTGELLHAVSEATGRQEKPTSAEDGLYAAVNLYSGAGRLHAAVCSVDKALHKAGLI